MQLSLLKEALKDVFGLPDEILKRITDGCDLSDFWITWYRLWQVYSNVAANGGSDTDPNSPDDKDNPESHYNHFNQAHHDLLVKSLVGLNIFSFIAKTIQVIYRAYRERQLDSFAYLAQQLERISITKDQQTKLSENIVSKLKSNNSIDQNSETSTSIVLQYLLAKKVANGIQFKINSESKDQIKLIKSSIISTVHAANDAEVKDDAKQEPQKDLDKEFSAETDHNFINQIRTSAAGKFTKKIWDTANGQALIFWIVWMLFNVAFGSKVIDPTPSSGISSISKPVIAKLRWLLTPIIVGITVGVMVIYGMGKGIYQIFQRHNPNIEKDKRPSVGDIISSFLATPLAPFVLVGSIVSVVLYSIYRGTTNLWKKIGQPSQKTVKYTGFVEREIYQPEIDDEQDDIPEQVNVKSIMSELRERFFMKMQHAKFKEILSAAFNLSAEKDIAQYTSLDKNKRNVEKIADIYLVLKLSEDQIALHKQKLKDHIFGTVREQRFSLVNHSVREGVKGFIGASFVLWWASYIISVAATHVGALAFLAGTAVVLTNPILAGIMGLAFAGIFVVKGFTKFKQDQAKYKTERYKELQEDDNKLHCLAKLAVALEAKKANINNLRTSITEQVVQYNQKYNENLDINHWKVSSYDLKKVNIYNHSNFVGHSTFFTYIIEGLGYIVEFLGGAQTGNFLARALFLAGSLIFGVASSFANPVFGFFVIAGSLSLIIGGNRLADYILKSRQQQRENFKMDRISCAKKLLKETDDVEKILHKNCELLENAKKQNIKEGSDSKPGQNNIQISPSAATEQAKSGVVHPPVFSTVTDPVDRANQLRTLQFAR